MKTNLFLAALFFISSQSFAQGGWTVCNIPLSVSNRVNDIFMIDTQTGYAIVGNQILKTTDGGDNWLTIYQDTMSGRSIEFINSQKGFAGGLNYNATSNSVLFKTIDGGSSWADITPLLDPRAWGGMCGMAIPDSNTIYGCGNWFQDSAYIVKSIDGGNTWSFIDMKMYATSLIDIYFLNKDTGFATGKGLLPLQTAVILYTTDGGLSWTYKFQNTLNYEYCWKIQRLTDQIYFASIQEMINSGQRILKSTDSGMTWNVHMVPFPSSGNGIQGIGFIDSLKGWTGGGWTHSYESNDGGLTWDTIPVCWGMNRVFKVNDTLLFASGGEIWKYSISATGISHPAAKPLAFASISCFPNPTDKNLTIDLAIQRSTRAVIVLLDEKGNRIKVIDNKHKAKGVYQYQVNTEKLPAGLYYVVLKTHEDDQSVKVVVTH